MKPSDHPDFFRAPPPDGRSRESTIRLDAQGHFWHAGQRVTHAALGDALCAWIGRHPEDGRFILSNGYDWTYFVVDDAPYVVRAVRIEPQRIVLTLSDGTEEAWDPSDTRVGPDHALYATVRRGAPGGPYEAKFTRHAQHSLGPALVEGGGQNPGVMVGEKVQTIGANGARFGYHPACQVCVCSSPTSFIRAPSRSCVRCRSKSFTTRRSPKRASKPDCRGWECSSCGRPK